MHVLVRVVVDNMNFWKQLFSDGSLGQGSGADLGLDNLPKPGIYKYDYQDSGERSRIHLRIDGDPASGDGNGILLVNANRVIHLNTTAALMAYLYLENIPDQETVRIIQHTYQVSGSQASGD